MSTLKSQVIKTPGKADVYPEYTEFTLLNPERKLTTQYDDDTLWRLFERVKSKPGDYKASITDNKIIYHFFEHFYKIERDMWDGNVELQEKIYRNRKKYIGKSQEIITNEEILRGFKIMGLNYGYSHFSHLWAKAFFEEFNIKTVLDLCGGWGQRLLGALDLDLYIYNDIWKESVDSVNKMIEFFGIKNVKTYNQDSATLKVEEEYECIFTCPPYYNLEIYNPKDVFPSKHHYLEWWEKSIDNNVNDKVKYIAFVINYLNIDDMIKSIEHLPYEVLRIQPIGRDMKSHLSKTSKRKGEQMVIMKRKDG